MKNEKQELWQKITKMKIELEYNMKLYSKYLTLLEVDAANLMQAIEKVTGITPENIIKKSRIHKYNLARQIYIHIMRKKRYTLKSIGKSISRDHATIIHHKNCMENFIENEPETARLTREIEKEFETITK